MSSRGGFHHVCSPFQLIQTRTSPLGYPRHLRLPQVCSLPWRGMESTDALQSASGGPKHLPRHSHLGELKLSAGTTDVRPLPGVVLNHYSARDVVSRWDVVGGIHSGHIHYGQGISRPTAAQDAVPGQSDPGGWRQRVSVGFRGSMPGDEASPIRAAATVSQAQWSCGASPTHPYRGVLRTL